jgi:hypothetical protein
LLVLGLSSSSILLYQFLQHAIGGRGQFLKASCHSWGFDSDALKDNNNARSARTPTQPELFDDNNNLPLLFQVHVNN